MKKRTKLNIMYIVLSIILLGTTVIFTNIYTKYLIMKEIQKYEVTTTETTIFKNNN